MSPENEQTPTPEADKPAEHTDGITEADQAERQRYQDVSEITTNYDQLVKQAKDEGRPFGISDVDRLIDQAQVSGNPPEMQRLVYALCLGNTELHEDTRRSLMEELAKPPTA